MKRIFLFLTVLLFLFSGLNCTFVKRIFSKKRPTDTLQVGNPLNIVEVQPCHIQKATIFSHQLAQSEVKYAQTYEDLNPMDKFMMIDGFTHRTLKGELSLDVLVKNPNTISVLFSALHWQCLFQNQLLDSGTVDIKQILPAQDNYWVRLLVRYDAMKLTPKNTTVGKTNVALGLNRFEHLQLFTQTLAKAHQIDSTKMVLKGNLIDSTLKNLPLK